MKAPLSKTMLALIKFMREHNGHVWRHPGGFWQNANWIHRYSCFSSATVEALISRGIAEYDEHKAGKLFDFPIRATLTQAYREQKTETPKP